MRLRKENVLLSLLLGTGVYLLDSLRDRLSEGADLVSDRARDRYDDLRHGARNAYDTVSDRMGRAADAIRGEDHHVLGTAGALLLGVGVGVGVGMLLAPASGEETRSSIKDRVRQRFARENEPATGTYGG